MAAITLATYDRTEWIYNGKSVRRAVIVPRLNCRPAKEVYDQEVSLITSECISQDTCAPFIKSYHKWSASLNLKETIPGIGLGCDMLSGTVSFTRRSQNSDAGNNAPMGIVRTAMDGIILMMMTGGTLVIDHNFDLATRADKLCPEPSTAVVA